MPWPSAFTRLDHLGLRDDDIVLRQFRRRRDRAAFRPRWRYEQPPQTIAEFAVDLELRHEGHLETPIYRQSYRTTCIPDQEWQRTYLEALRYKWRYRPTDTVGTRMVSHVVDHAVTWMRRYGWMFGL